MKILFISIVTILFMGNVGLQVNAAEKRPDFKRVFIVVLENTSPDAALKQPFMKRLAQEGAYLGNLYALSHPSQPNYFALTAGNTFDKGNELVDLNVSHIGDLLEAKGRSWKVYAEGFPGNCFKGKNHKAYARRHNPFISYVNVQNDPKRCARIVNSSELEIDIAKNQLADYSLMVPDVESDGHDTGVEYADRYLDRTFSPLLKDPRFTNGMLFVVTFDEDDRFHGNRVYTSFWGSSVVAGAKTTEKLTHYSLLRLIEDTFGLSNLGRGDAGAKPITGIWK